VVDPEDRRLREMLAEQGVERAGRGQVPPEGLLDDDPSDPVEADPDEAADDVREVGWRDGEVEESGWRAPARLAARRSYRAGSS